MDLPELLSTDDACARSDRDQRRVTAGRHAAAQQWIRSGRDKSELHSGTRLAVAFLVELLANGWTHEQILKDYPHLTEEDIKAALHYATEMLKEERVYPLRQPVADGGGPES